MAANSLDNNHNTPMMINQLTAREVSQLLRISLSQLCRMSKRGKIPCMNISDSPKNSQFRYEPQEIEQWLKGRRQKHSTTQYRGGVRRRLQRSTSVIRS